MSNPKAVTRIDAELSELGINWVNDMTGRTPRRMREVRCPCGASERVYFQASMPPAVIVKNFRDKGWLVSATSTECPTCSQPQRKRITPMTTPKSVEPSAAQASHAIKVFRKLEEVFVEQRYAAGWTDERVGKECGGLAKQFVAQIRDAEFGPIKGSPEYEALKSEFDTLSGMLRQFGERLRKLDEA